MGKIQLFNPFYSSKGYSEQLCSLHLGSNADHLANFITFQGVEMPPVQKLLVLAHLSIVPTFYITKFFIIQSILDGMEL